MQTLDSSNREVSYSNKLTLAIVLLLSFVIASVADYGLVSWLKVPRPPSSFIGVYRRAGPESGPQVFCAGSSLTESALSWSKVSAALEQGIETWGVGGSSPDIWEEWQKLRPQSNVTIVGISVYDLNEMHLADARANVVPLSRTLGDLWSSHVDPALSHRILTQYPLKYLRLLLPSAGNADKVLVGLRTKIASLRGRQGGGLAAHEGVSFQPPPPILDAGESTSSVSEWSPDYLLRRLAALRAEDRGHHEFLNGPKNRALHRLLSHARKQGRVILLVLPVSRPYTQEFIDGNTDADFEQAISQGMAIVPEATLIRLDRVPDISDPANFADLVHMNSLGRRFATEAFLKVVTHRGSPPTLGDTPVN
jgi:hypothetical protein